MKLNPHGDSAIYETLVRLTEGNGALLTPFVDSKGNFGKQYSRDMAYAASRYTEVKLAPICQEVFADIDKNTVEFVDNYDGSMQEPFYCLRLFPIFWQIQTSGLPLVWQVPFVVLTWQNFVKQQPHISKIIPLIFAMCFLLPIFPQADS